MLQAYASKEYRDCNMGGQRTWCRQVKLYARCLAALNGSFAFPKFSWTHRRLQSLFCTTYPSALHAWFAIATLGCSQLSKSLNNCSSTIRLVSHTSSGAYRHCLCAGIQVEVLLPSPILRKFDVYERVALLVKDVLPPPLDDNGLLCQRSCHRLLNLVKLLDDPCNPLDRPAYTAQEGREDGLLLLKPCRPGICPKHCPDRKNLQADLHAQAQRSCGGAHQKDSCKLTRAYLKSILVDCQLRALPAAATTGRHTSRPAQ